MDSFTIAGKAFTSRLIVGTGKYKSGQETARAIDEIARAVAGIAEGAERQVKMVDEATSVTTEAVRLGDRVYQAELGYWLTKAGQPAQTPGGHPYAVQAAGRWREAAALWDAAGCPYEHAAALAESPDPQHLLAALETLEVLLDEYQFSNEPSRSVVHSMLISPLIRAVLPLVPAPAGEVRVEGLGLARLAHALEIGPAPTGKVRQNVDLDAFEQETGLRLQPVVIEQHSPAPDGLTRDWPRPDAGIEKPCRPAQTLASIRTGMSPAAWPGTARPSAPGPPPPDSCSRPPRTRRTTTSSICCSSWHVT